MADDYGRAQRVVQSGLLDIGGVLWPITVVCTINSSNFQQSIVYGDGGSVYNTPRPEPLALDLG
jgi:hypothetical protein